MTRKVLGLAVVLVILTAVGASAQDKFFSKTDVKQVWVERDTSTGDIWLIVEFNESFSLQGITYNGCSRVVNDYSEAHQFALWIAKGKIKGFRVRTGGTRNGLALADITRWYYK